MHPHYAKNPLVSFTAIAQDPHTLFVSWDADAIGSDKLTGKVGGNVRAIAGWSLRLTSLTSGEITEFDINPEWGRYYTTGLRAGENYRVALMMTDTVREKHSFVHCGPLSLPSDKISTEEVAGWEISIEEFRRLFADVEFTYTWSA